MARTFVLGLGNVLMGDDAFGPVVVHAFDDRYSVGPEVEIVDLGTPGLDMTPWMADAERVIVVDTVRAGRRPGTPCRYTKDDVMRQPPGPRVGPHDPGMRETLGTLELLGRAPREVVIVGIEPAHTELGRPLSPPVAAGVHGAVAAVVAALQAGGLEVWRRSVPLEPDRRWQPLVAR